MSSYWRIPDVRPSDLVREVQEKIAERREVEAIIKAGESASEARARLMRRA